MPQDTATFLKSLPYFASLPPEVVGRLAEQVTSRTYARGELVLLEGDPANAAYFVQSGEVRVYMLSAEGRVQVLSRLGAGQAVSLVPIFDGQPNPASVEAVNLATVLSLPRDVLLALVREQPAVAEAMLADLAARLRRITILAADLSLRTVRSRLARFLLRYADQPGRRLTQAEMAAELGTVRDVVGRTLSDLQAEGLISIQRHRIIIRDRARLEAQAE